MKVVFVDGENVGLKVVEKIDSALSDKVLVFSKSANIEQHCDKALFQHFSNYPTGSNQADFLIIANLTKYLTVYDPKALSKAELVLYNSVGKFLQRWNFEGMAIHETLFLGELPQGAYNLKLITEEGFATKSLIKL